MARVIRSNPLTRSKMRVGDAYDVFLRSRNSLCAKATVNVYREIGERIIIPGLAELTDDDMNAITADVLRCLLDDYASSHTGGGTVFLYRHLKAFINWFWAEYDLDSKNPMRKVSVKKADVPPKEGITAEEVDALIRTAKSRSVFPERDIAMLMILCDTGIRKSSLNNLKMKDVNIARSEITVFEKDQRYHIKAFGAATTKAIKKYLDCLADVKPEDPFWLCMDGSRLQKDGLREILRRLCAEAQIPMHHFHDFRRFYALELYRSTHDVYLVSRALDHKDIEVTKRYLRTDELEDQQIARTFSPMDRRAQMTGAKVKRV